MNKKDVTKLINELEVEIKETDELIKQAYLASESMVEPVKSKFVDALILKDIQLNGQRYQLEILKGLIGA